MVGSLYLLQEKPWLAEIRLEGLDIYDPVGSDPMGV